MEELIQRAVAGPGALNVQELVKLLTHSESATLFQAAYRVKERHSGRKVFLRGIIELGNRCVKDCFYCGIRKSNRDVRRYRLSEEAILRMARWAYDQRYGSIVLQSGEQQSEENTAFIERILQKIRDFSGGELGITLSLGEQSESTLQRWRAAGAQRYLLRIESSSPVLYAKLHPADHSFECRQTCIRTLKKLGYQTGSGVMIGLPGQTISDLAEDIEFFRKNDLDMIGMGPYIPHPQTPTGQAVAMTDEFIGHQLALALKMIAVTRLQLHDVNIAATTALQALDDRGREQGLQAGANVLMPNITDTKYRKDYQLYENKPCLDENAAQCRGCLNWRVLSIGEEIAWGIPGNSPHFQKGK